MFEVLTALFIILSAGLGVALYKSINRLGFYEDMQSDMYSRFVALGESIRGVLSREIYSDDPVIRNFVSQLQDIEYYLQQLDETYKFNTLGEEVTDETNVRRLKNITTCENMSFEEVIAKYDSPTTYFYCDPPYWNTEDYYSLHGFGREEHFQLMNCLHNMEGKFSLSYYDFDELSDMYPKDKFKWETKEFVKASGAREGEAQSIGEEVLIMNYQQL